MVKKLWPLVANRLGGVHSVSKFLIIIHDSGLVIAKDNIIKFECKL
jgi:hypothetical protein